MAYEITDEYGEPQGFVDPKLAKQSWEEGRDWDGNNHISRATGSQWDHETLYLSSKGRYYVIHTSQWQGSLPSTRWLTPQEAAEWLIRNEHELPDDLAEYNEALVE